MIVVPDFKAILQRRREQWPWFDHTVRAAQRYKSQNGDYYAAAMTYFSVLALFPLLMVAFAAAGFVLAGQPQLLDEISDQITQNVPGSLAKRSTLSSTLRSSRGRASASSVSSARSTQDWGGWRNCARL